MWKLYVPFDNYLIFCFRIFDCLYMLGNFFILLSVLYVYLSSLSFENQKIGVFKILFLSIYIDSDYGCGNCRSSFLFLNV